MPVDFGAEIRYRKFVFKEERTNNIWPLRSHECLDEWSRLFWRAKPLNIRLTLIVLTLSLSGCAFMVHDVRIDYAFHGTVDTVLSTSLQPFQLGPFEDNRGNPNVRMIIHETNGYGQPTAGGWQAEKPVAEIVRDAISQGLAVAHAPLVESGAALILTGEVQEYRYRFEEKFWSGDVFPMLTVAFRLRDSTSRETVWKHTVTGSGKYHGSFMPSTEFLFRSALDDLVIRVVSDPGLSDALSHRMPGK